MIFRNLTFFRFPSHFEGLFPTPVADSLDGLSDALREAALKPVGPMQLFSSGFLSPYGVDSDVFTQRVGDAVLVTLGRESRVLPAAVVDDLLRKKLAEVEQQEGHRPGGRARKRIKEDLIAELLPRAFVEPSRGSAYFDMRRGFIAVDLSSRSGSEFFVSSVRAAIGSFPALPLNAETAPRAILTGWLAGNELPEGLSLGDECELHDPADSGAKVKIQRLELGGEEVQSHLEAGMQCVRLALVLDDHASFVFGEDLVVRKLKLLDGAMEALDSQEREDIQQELDARLALMAGEVGRLFDVLERAFKITSAEGDAPARRGDLMDNTTVTLSGPGMEPITMTGEQFSRAAKKARARKTSTTRKKS